MTTNSGPSRQRGLAPPIDPSSPSSSPDSQSDPIPFLLGDQAEGFEVFYATHRDPVARTLAFTFNDRELGFEAADEAMARAYRHWSKISTYDNPEGWVFKVGLNWGHSWIRRRLTAMIKAPMLVADTPPTVIEDLVADPDLAAAIASLKRDHRTVIVLRFQRDYSVAQIAEVLGIAEGTVKSRLSRAMERLGTQLETTETTEKS